jgi:hypothetical protein
MTLHVKGSRYEILDVLEGMSGTRHREVFVYHIFYAKDYTSKLYWVDYLLPASEHMIMTYDEIMLFAMHNKHREDNVVVGSRYEYFIDHFSLDRYTNLRTKLRKYLIQNVLDDDL